MSEARETKHLTAYRELLERRANRISWARFLFVTGGVAAALGLRDLSGDRVGVLAGVVVLVVFLWLVRMSARVRVALRRVGSLERIRKVEAARAAMDFGSLPVATRLTLPEEHPFAHDLNIFGDRGLFRLLDTTVSEGGRRLLRDWVLDPPILSEEIARRQELVRSLVAARRFRERLALEASMLDSPSGAGDRLRLWLTGAPSTDRTRALPLLWGLSLLTLALLALFLLGLSKPWFLFSWVVYFGTYVRSRRPIRELFDEAYQIESGLRSFLPVLRFLERTRVAGSADQLLEVYRADNAPSVFVKRITSVAAAAGTGKSDLLGFVLNATVPWDLHFARLLDRLRPSIASHLAEWLDRWYELEAMCALAGYADRTDNAVFPRFGQDGPIISAVGLAHPLIPPAVAVPNDFELTRPGEVALVTGSNMSGKTTFLRTVCLNMVLARLGTAVVAEEFCCKPVRLFTSIQIADSLSDGISYFYAEVRRFKWMLRMLDEPGEPLMFAIDEIFRGTNNRERLIGSRALLDHLTHQSGCGLISTHDLELTALAETNTSVHNYHFTDEVRDGMMSFDYQLRRGPCPVTNALAIMQREGLPVRPPEDN